MSVKCRDIIKVIEKLAPPYLAMEYDNVGLLIGDEDSIINSVLVSLDINDDVIDEAVNNNFNLIITHHPVIFSPLKSINIKNFKERIVYKLISNGINVYSVHTNLDAAENGINDFLARKLGLLDVSILEKVHEDKLYKIAVYVPAGYEGKVREAITAAGGGCIGNYSSCTFNIQGEGTFMPLDGTVPFIGSIGTLEHVKEVKIETITPSYRLKPVIDAMLKAHPYEEPAFDIYPLINEGKKYGLGRIGYLKTPLTLKELCFEVKNILNISGLRVVGKLHRAIKKVAICSGSGADFIDIVYNLGCDVYITGDIKYHAACDVRDMGLAIIDAGHYETENIYMEYLSDYIRSQCQSKNYDVNIILSQKNSNPLVTI